MPRSQEDWSDSDDAQDSFDEEGYTSVHLGIPSDEIDVEEDLCDPYVSRIGGTPVRPSLGQIVSI
jgi:pre-rRNA-processing protein TSR4